MGSVRRLIGLVRLSTLVCVVFGAVHIADAFQSTGAAQVPAAASDCLAIVLPEVEGVPRDAIEVGSAVQQLFKSFLAGPTVDVALLDARLLAQASEEARQKQCSRMLVAKLTGKAGGGRLGRVFGHVASGAAWFTPGGATVGSAIARGVAIGGAQALVDMAATTKAKDEIRLEYQIIAPGGALRFGPKTVRAKAAVDGEDLLTPAVRKAAEAIAASAAQAK